MLFNSFNGTSVSTRAEASDVTWQECTTTLIDRAYEAEIIDEWLPEKNGNLKEGLDTDFLFYADKDLELEFYPVYSQTTTPNDLGLFYYDATGNYHEVIIWESMNPYGLTETEHLWSEEKGNYQIVSSKGIQINIPEGFYFGFYWKGNLFGGTETTYYSDFTKNEETFCTDGHGNKLDNEPTSKIHAVTFKLEGKTYLGLEDWTDFDYQDWVFTCDEELKSGDASTFDPENPNKPEEGGNTGGNTGGGNTGGTVTPNPTPNPNPNGKYENNEVEINLSINEIHTLPGGAYKYGLADLVSKLSIHVRYPHDVEVILPVPEQIYCDQDDLYILKDHYFAKDGNPNWRYGGDRVTWTSFLGGNPVTLAVDYVPAEKDNLTSSEDYVTLEDGTLLNFGCGYIRVHTEGINQDVIDYCRKNFGDGINFEVYNYYNRGNQYTTGSYASITTEELQYYFLSRSMVNFDVEVINVADKIYPNFYINAFHKDLDGNPVKGDCYVWILGDNHAKCIDHGLYFRQTQQLLNGTEVKWDSENRDDNDIERNNFFKPYQGEHFNGSPFNWIYTSKGVTGAKDSADMLDNGYWPFAQDKNAANAPYQYFKVREDNLYNFKPNN